MTKVQELKRARQRGFNKVWRRFIVERRPKCTDDEGGCVYYKDNGDRCAIGLLLPMRDAKKMATVAGDVSLIWGLPFVRKIRHLGYEFCRDLQSAHDSNSSMRGMQASLCVLAATYELKVPS